MKILYSFNKKGFEADYWQREIAAASDGRIVFVPFNHDPYVPVSRYLRAQLLDNLYFARDPGLIRLYDALQHAIARERPDAMVVDNANPYHPDFLRPLPIYKVLRTSDGPTTAYDRDFGYVHAFDHVLYHSPAYNAAQGMAAKLREIGAKRADFWPMAVFDRMFDVNKTEETILADERDVDIVFVGALAVDKMPLLARVKKAFGRRFRIHGLSNWKRNAYFNAKFGFPGWVRPLPFEEYVPLYQRSRIGINVHLRGVYTVGNYRMLDLPANGVMQISDGGRYLSEWFDVGREIVAYEDGDELVRKIAYYLDHDDERRAIAAAGYRAAMQRHRIRRRLHEAARIIGDAIVQHRHGVAP